MSLETNTAYEPKKLGTKRHVMYVLLALLAITSLIAIVSIIAGRWSDASARAIGVSVSSGFHVLIALFIVDQMGAIKRLDYWWIYSRTIFVANIASLVVSVALIADFLFMSYAVALYQFIIAGLTAPLIAIPLLNFSAARGGWTMALARAASLTLTALTFGFLFVVFSPHFEFPNILFRILGATAILVSTLCLATIVVGKMNEPERIGAELPEHVNGAGVAPEREPFIPGSH